MWLLWQAKTKSFISVLCSGYFFAIPFFVAFFSHCKVFSKIRQHKLNVDHLFQKTNNRTRRISVQEINVSRALSFVAGGFLFCWIPIWSFVFWKRFCPETSPRVVQLLATLFYSWVLQLIPSFMLLPIRCFVENFAKLLCWWKTSNIVPEGDSVAEKRSVDNGVMEEQA